MPRGIVALIALAGFCIPFLLELGEVYAGHQNKRVSSLGNKAQLNALRTPGSIRYIGNTLVLPPGMSTRIRTIGGRIVAPPGSANFIRGLQVNRPALRGLVSGPLRRDYSILARPSRGYFVQNIKAPALGLVRATQPQIVHQDFNQPDRAAIAKDFRAIFRRADQKLDQALNR